MTQTITSLGGNKGDKCSIVSIFEESDNFPWRLAIYSRLRLYGASYYCERLLESRCGYTLSVH